MDGQVRDDLHSDLIRWERSADLVLALGSSLCGMAADQLVRAVAERARKGKALGAVIVALQQTACDADAALRIFAPLDRVAALLREELKLEIADPRCPYVPMISPQYILRTDVFTVPY